MTDVTDEPIFFCEDHCSYREKERPDHVAPGEGCFEGKDCPLFEFLDWYWKEAEDD